MPLTTYDELQAAIGDWLERADLAARIPDFIMLFEAAANRRLRVREQEAAATLAPSSGTAALPADYLAWRRVNWAGARRVELDYVHPSYLQAAWPSSPSGVPRVFTIEGAVLKIRPVDDAALELDYFRKIPSLASGANWLFGSHPDLYLFGALVEGQAFALDPQAAVMWKARRDEIFDEIEKLSNKTRGTGAVRVFGATP
jgi:hypothetical protein